MLIKKFWLSRDHLPFKTSLMLVLTTLLSRDPLPFNAYLIAILNQLPYRSSFLLIKKTSSRVQLPFNSSFMHNLKTLPLARSTPIQNISHCIPKSTPI